MFNFFFFLTYDRSHINTISSLDQLILPTSSSIDFHSGTGNSFQPGQSWLLMTRYPNYKATEMELKLQ
ncbi:hypothetical protein QVD17_25756 [Tagetes erecta]|uniref:Uncharacterized protein n=1 Tax=Tagetes erecta TaxID=13708 RepID=A0AAD8NQ50_TARER|nr:hypothetical protein QVD17_25756 [Tagetes erecta]